MNSSVALDYERIHDRGTGLLSVHVVATDSGGQSTPVHSLGVRVANVEELPVVDETSLTSMRMVWLKLKWHI